MEERTPETTAGTPDTAPAPLPAAAEPAALAAARAPDLGKRAVAFLIDGVILAVIGQLTIVGALAGFAGWLVRDVAVEGRSPGKKVMGLKTVTASGAPLTLDESIRRNAVFAVGGVAMILSKLTILGALLAIPVALAGLALAALEAYLVATGKERIGDRIAGTRVVDEQPRAAIAG